MTRHTRIERPVHLEVEVLGDILVQTLCENNAGRDAFGDLDESVEMTIYDEHVTCQACRVALGYDPIARKGAR